MSGCFTTIFKYWFWGLAFVLICIVGSIARCSSDLGYSYTRHQVRSSLEDNDLDAAVSRMHDYFVDECYADTMQVTHRQGALAEEVIDQCLEGTRVKLLIAWLVIFYLC